MFRLEPGVFFNSKVHTMMLSMIRKVSSILLLLCFVLPLSTCASKMKPQQEAQSQNVNSQSVQKEAEKDNSLYGYVLLNNGWEDIRKNKTIASGMTMLAVFVVFFLPCCLLALKEKPQAIATLLASTIAGPALFFWVLVWGTPQIGGVLAVTCWSSLLLVSLAFSCRWALHWWRQRKTQT